MSSWSVRGAVVLTAVGLALAGCTNSTDPTTDGANPGAVVSASSTPEPTARPTFENIPPENEGLEPPSLEDYPGVYEDTPEGAQDALEFFVMAQQYAYATGDTGPMESMFTPEDCEDCEWLVGKIHEKARAGEFIIYESFTVTNITPRDEHQLGTAVQLQGIRAGTIDISPSSERSKPSDHAVHAGGALKYDGTAWKLRGFDWYVE